MTDLHGFMISNVFYDDKNFPRGFKRSGDFTIQEADILSQLGSRLILLKQLKVSPESEQEAHFVKMCTHNLIPETKVESVWAKYENLITSGKPKFTLQANAADIEDDTSFDDDAL